MAFNPAFNYFNKWYVLGTITDIKEQTRADASSWGAKLVVQTGEPSGFAHVTIFNTRDIPDVYSALVTQFEIGSRVAVGFDGQYLQLQERVSNGKCFRSFQQRQLPVLATLNQHERISGKVCGELVDKTIDGDKLTISIVYYDRNKDGTERLYKDQTNPQLLTFNAYGNEAATLHNAPIGSNVELGLRMFNMIERNDYGDVTGSINEVRVEQVNVNVPQPQQPQLTASMMTPQQLSQAQQSQVLPFGHGQAASLTQPGFPSTQTQAFPPQQANPFGQTQQATPFPFASQQ